jgi:hypothetical protein
LAINVYRWLLDWQVSSTAQISNALSQVLSAVEHLTLDLDHDVHWHSQSSDEHNGVGRIEWRNLLRSFGNVKTLRVEDRLIEELSHCLQLEDEELPLGRDAGDAFFFFFGIQFYILHMYLRQRSGRLKLG